jgi:hypothetical protein
MSESKSKDDVTGVKKHFCNYIKKITGDNSRLQCVKCKSASKKSEIIKMEAMTIPRRIDPYESYLNLPFSN